MLIGLILLQFPMKSRIFSCSRIGILVFALTFIFTESQAQMFHFGRSWSKYKKYNPRKQNNRPGSSIFLAYNYNLPYNVHFMHYFAGNDNSGRYIQEYNYKRSVMAQPVLSVAAGTHWPVLNFTDKMILAFTLGAEVNMMKANTGTVSISPYQSYEASFEEAKFSLPFGVAFKYGVDASLVKKDRFSGMLGIAAAPSYVMTKFGDYFSDSRFTVTPFVFAELGVFGGMNWKIRATCMPFGIAGFKRSPGDAGMDAFPNKTSINAKSDAIFQVGLSIQPFSFLWDTYHD